jgi:TPP-dependent pyruvate/acetoin dehydrogenase alpha subunit
MDRSTTLAAYRLMLTSRGIDDRCQRLLASGVRVPNYHSGVGQEAMSVGVGLSAQSNDYLLFTYRDFGMLLAKGIDLSVLAGDLLLRTSGGSHGHGGIMHVVSADHGVVGRNSIFGSRFGIAVGLGLAAAREQQVVICPFGEAEGTRGPLYEALNLACLLQLPVIFVAENNGFSISSRTERLYAAGGMSGMFRAAPLPVAVVDGNDVAAVYHACAAAVEFARAGLGPVFLEMKTYRIDPHIPGDDDSRYRSPEEVEVWRQRDPIGVCERRITQSGFASPVDWAELKAGIDTDLDKAFDGALHSPGPDIASLYEHLYYQKGMWSNRSGGGHE